MRRRATCGLTVLEVTAASFILLLFLTALFGTISTLSNQRTLIERSALPYSIGPAVLDVICDDLRSALIEPYKDFDAFRAEGDTIGGADTTKIDFVTAVSSRAKVRVDDEWVRSALCEVGYRLRRSEHAEGLYALYRREDFGVDDKPLEGGKYYKLCDRVVEFRLDFFKDDPGDPEADDAEGLRDWDAQKEKLLPWSVRVTLTLLPPVDVDDRGDPVEEVEPRTFTRYVSFPQRFDTDATPAGGGSGNPGSGGN